MKGRAVEPWHPPDWSMVPIVGWALSAIRDLPERPAIGRIKWIIELLAGTLFVIFGISGVVWGGITLISGGFKSGNAVAIEQLNSKTDQINSRYDGLAKDNNDIKKTLADILDRLPRPSDNQATQHHFESLDTSVGQLTGRVGSDEADFRELKGRLDPILNGTATQTRNPR